MDKLEYCNDHLTSTKPSFVSDRCSLDSTMIIGFLDFVLKIQLFYLFDIVGGFGAAFGFAALASKWVGLGKHVFGQPPFVVFSFHMMEQKVSLLTLNL